ncbi:glutathione synthase [Alkalilimnicola ehrlichii]|uniref:Glutathione synthetase n=1 Tax=Alkalilimnicola ehrlichii TaxID=351052 RepID=A0A3E0X3U2_9GAMM|nr:glutathione synthase [Alkalilimnicola ehrlichii]RFA31208.1 glutathione synthase [Alkalilimnicola ehrlichii]RFA39510.1 glutathione synthase [Alkalilimnicola ehrlichii]
MTIQIGVVMDPIESIKPYKDTTLAMLLEAQARNWDIRYLEMSDLSVRDGEAWGSGRRLRVDDNNSRWFELGDRVSAPLAELDIILMRKDPPVDNQFLYATYILELAERAGCLVLNKPQGLRDANEKLFTARFAQCCTPTLVSRDAKELRAFIAQHGKAVLKPLHGMGGTSIFVVEAGDTNTSVIIETLTEQGTEYAMAQRYIPEISAGDKRILVINGKPVDYALARIPAAGESRGNIAAGGRGEGVPLSDRDRWICDQVAPTLLAHGLYFVGLDVIGDYLTEVNVTSPTCVRELDEIYNINISAQFFDAIETLLAQRPKG